MNLQTKGKLLLKFGVAVLVGGPWLYNLINKYTKRSQDLHENIDFGNAMLMFIVPSVFFIVLFMILHKMGISK
jgi:uncharacterized membrane protein YidH (DUF202 family)